MTRRAKYSIGSGTLLLLLGLVAFGVASRREAGAVEVETEALRTRELVSIVTASGEIQPQRSVDVHANVNGTIERVAVREGQEVAQGDFLLQIDPVPAEAASAAQAAHRLRPGIATCRTTAPA